ncbi:SurA N-terminal domain-containing protein [Novosphingobium sp. 1949]|uniref:Parvulin-like PPIase n=1 Tax=Novosphingobium organovorum TaxID=2930092 RepID=A0ABT0B8E0_9SPHN|nr:peptidylprolyl isomerase [Novosphingobium organovorum]MCJ2181113.1 SurA N-terminal domain-containing protein [Novosphingobium organovorum]
MLSFFRSFLQSKIGAGIALAVLVVIALAFASGDIAGFGSGSGVGDGTTVASVGSEKVTTNDLVQGANVSLKRVQTNNPQATMAQLLEQGGLDTILDELVQRSAVFVFGKENGIVAGDRLVDSEIAQISAFQGVDGKFDQKAFRQALAQQGLSEKTLREDIARGLVGQQLVTPAQFGASMPAFMATRYAQMIDETRSGSVLALPSALFAPKDTPDDATLESFYKSHTSSFIRPERRVMRYATFTIDEMPAPAAPSEAQISARYETEKARFAAKDERRITQVIASSEADAKAIVAAVDSGKSLEEAAKAKGLSAAKLEFFNRQTLTDQYSKAVADAVFAAPIGKLAQLAKSPLGWNVIRVEEENKTPAKSIDAVKGDLIKEIEADERRKAFAARLESIEDKFSNGASLPEVAKALNIAIKTTEPITADGRIYGKNGETVPADLQPLLPTVFKMDQEQPQLTQMGQGQDFSAGRPFAIYDVTQITPSAPAPFKEIKDDVKVAWALDTGSKAAKAAALKVQAEMAKGKSMTVAMAATGKTLPPIEQVGMSRATLSRALQSGRQVPPPVSLMFHMTKGSVKVQSADGERGWFVVELKDITQGKTPAPEIVAQARKELGAQLGDAYAAAYGHAVESELSVKKDPAAIKAVKARLGGTAAPGA